MTFLVLTAALLASSCPDGGADEAACIMQAASAFEAEAAARERALEEGHARALEMLYDGTGARPELEAEPVAARLPAHAPSLTLTRFTHTTTAVTLAGDVEDRDADGLTEGAEKEIAQALMPELEWAKGEPCGEHITLYQVHPLAPGRVRVVFALVFPVDCGFRGTGIGGHPGDVQEISLLGEYTEGAWRATALDLPWHQPMRPTFWPARLYISAGKHHIYPAEANCAWGRFLMFDRCGAGERGVPTLRAEDNVGERGAPLMFDLARFPGERAWGKSAWNDAWFCGGDPKRGDYTSKWARFKAFFGISACADALDGKWDRDPVERLQ